MRRRLFQLPRVEGRPIRRSRSRVLTAAFEIALRHRGDAFRILYAVQIDTALWVIHAFKKKSKTGIKTPHMDVDLIRERIKRLKEALK